MTVLESLIENAARIQGDKSVKKWKNALLHDAALTVVLREISRLEKWLEENPQACNEIKVNLWDEIEKLRTATGAKTNRP